MDKEKQSMIISAASIAGVAGTAYLAALGQHKADKVVAENGGEENLTKKEIAKLTWKYYILAGLGFAATSTLIGVNQHNITTLAIEVTSLGASLSALAANKNKIEAKLREELGDDAVNELKNKLRFTEKPDEAFPPAVLSKEKDRRFNIDLTGNGNQLFIEDYSGRAFRSSREAVERGLHRFNIYLIRNKYATFNDLYRFLDLKENTFGMRQEWFYDGDGSNCSDEGIRFELTDGTYSEWYKEAATYIDMPYDPPFSRDYDY